MTIFTYRAQLGAADPTDVFVPLLITTLPRHPGRLFVTGLFQKLNCGTASRSCISAARPRWVGGHGRVFRQPRRRGYDAAVVDMSNVLLFGLSSPPFY